MLLVNIIWFIYFSLGLFAFFILFSKYTDGDWKVFKWIRENILPKINISI